MALVALAVLAVLAVPACSSTSGTGDPSPATGTVDPMAAAPPCPTRPGGRSGPVATSTAPSPPTSPVPGADLVTAMLRAGGVPVAAGGDFYAVPDPLAPGAPGSIIRAEPAPNLALLGTTVVRVMYHSRDHNGCDVAVTGFIAVPQRPAPPGGWPVVSWAHGTTGIGPTCAPSKEVDGNQELPQHLVDTGHVLVATDYLGLGPPGQRHAYLSGVSEGQATIDIVRAARAIPFAETSTRWVAVGHSQGGQAALFAAQLAPAYAPELELLGAVAAAPVVPTTFLDPLGDVGDQAFVVMALLGLPTDYPDLDPAAYLSPAAFEAVGAEADTGCGSDIAGSLLALPPGGLLSADPRTTGPAAGILAENDPGDAATPVPVLLVHGTADVTVLPATSAALLRRMCANGQVASRVEVPGVDHGALLLGARDQIDAWIGGRVAGYPVPDDCLPTG